MPEEQLIDFFLFYFNEDLAADLDILLDDVRKKVSRMLAAEELDIGLKCCLSDHFAEQYVNSLDNGVFQTNIEFSKKVSDPINLGMCMTKTMSNQFSFCNDSEIKIIKGKEYNYPKSDGTITYILNRDFDTVETEINFTAACKNSVRLWLKEIKIRSNFFVGVPVTCMLICLFYFKC